MAILIGHEIKQLNSPTTIHAFSATPQAVYTAPSAKKVVITRVVLRCDAVSGLSTVCTAKVEINPAAGDVFVAEVLIGATSVDDTWVFSAENRGLVIPAGGQVDLTVTNAATGTSQTFIVDVFGYVVF